MTERTIDDIDNNADYIDKYADYIVNDPERTYEEYDMPCVCEGFFTCYAPPGFDPDDCDCFMTQ